MPGLTAPLFSLDATGTLAKTLTYSKWRGIKYVRQRVIPTNPNSTDQQAVREVFRNLAAMWLYMPTGGKLPWQAAAAGQPFTDRNKFVSSNLPQLYGFATLGNMLGSPGFGGAPVPTAMVVTPGALHLAVNLTPGALPSGWTLDRGAAIAIEQIDPNTQAFEPIIGYDSDANPALVDITGLDAATTYRVMGWAEYTKPDGSLAYSVSLNTGGVTP